MAEKINKLSRLHHCDTTQILLFPRTKKPEILSPLGTLKVLGHTEGNEGTQALKALGSIKHSGPPGNWVLTTLYLVNSWISLHHIMQLYFQSVLAPYANICFHSSLWHERKWETGKAIDFAAQENFAARLLDLPLI